MSKGSRQRPYDRDAFGRGYEQTFRSWACTACDGTGQDVDMTSPYPCYWCDGTGRGDIEKMRRAEEA